MTDLSLLFEVLSVAGQNVSNSTVVEADGETVMFFWIHKRINIDRGVVVAIVTPSLEVLGFQLCEVRPGASSSEKFNLLRLVYSVEYH
jgi:hypothetical protein